MSLQKELDLWDERHERDFISWKSRVGNKKLTKEDFRNYILNIKNEFDMEDVFDKLETGLEAFEKIVALSSKLPKYNLPYDLDETYEEEGNQIVKEFIKFATNLFESGLVILLRGLRYRVQPLHWPG